MYAIKIIKRHRNSCVSIHPSASNRQIWRKKLHQLSLLFFSKKEKKKKKKIHTNGHWKISRVHGLIYYAIRVADRTRH